MRRRSLLSYRQQHVRVLYRYDLLTEHFFIILLFRVAGNKLNRNAKQKPLAIEMNMPLRQRWRRRTYAPQRTPLSANAKYHHKMCVLHDFFLYGRARADWPPIILKYWTTGAHIPSFSRVCHLKLHIRITIHSIRTRGMNRRKRSNRLAVFHLWCTSERVCVCVRARCVPATMTTCVKLLYLPRRCVHQQTNRNVCLLKCDVDDELYSGV